MDIIILHNLQVVKFIFLQLWMVYYVNPALVQVLYQLLVGNANLQSQNKENEKQTQTIYNSTRQIQQQDQFSEDNSNNLFQIHVPNAFLNKPLFKKLFYHLVKVKHIVPLGLFRLQNSTDNRIPYTCTNPNPNTVLTNKDTVLVLAKEMPQSDAVNWGGTLEEIMKNQNFTYNSFKKDSTSSSDDSDFININENSDKELQKVKQFNNETEMVINKISLAMEEIQKDSMEMQTLMRLRQDKVLKRLKDIFTEELQLIQQTKAEISQNLTCKSSDD